MMLTSSTADIDLSLPVYYRLSHLRYFIVSIFKFLNIRPTLLLTANTQTMSMQISSVVLLCYSHRHKNHR